MRNEDSGDLTAWFVPAVPTVGAYVLATFLGVRPVEFAGRLGAHGRQAHARLAVEAMAAGTGGMAGGNVLSPFPDLHSLAVNADQLCSWNQMTQNTDCFLQGTPFLS